MGREERRMSDIDHTVIVNGRLPKSWTCPHCGKRQKLDAQDNEIFMTYMRFIRHCERCGYLHSWKLELTETFKQDVVKRLQELLSAEREEK